MAKLYVYSRQEYVRDEDGFGKYISVPVFMFNKSESKEFKLKGVIELGV